MYGQNLRLLVESEGAPAVEQTLRKMVREKKAKLAGSDGPGTDIHLDELYEAFVGMENLSISQRNRGFIEQDLRENAGVRVSQFTNITGELISSILIDRYEREAAIGDMLSSPYNSNLREERVAGFTASEYPKEVKEGDAYEDSGIGEKYVQVSDQPKKGRIISLTEEVIYFDQTGQIIMAAEGIGEACGQERAETILKAILGVTTSYYPSGTPTALYQGAPYLVTSNPLTDWSSIQTAMLTGFKAMRDENNKPIVVRPKILLVPMDLEWTAKRIINAVEIVSKTPTIGTAGTTAQAQETKWSNPVEGLTIVSSMLVSYVQSTNPTTNWWIGDPQKQFKRKVVFPFQTFREVQNAQLQFERDIVARFKVRYKEVFFAIDNKYVVMCTA